MLSATEEVAGEALTIRAGNVTIIGQRKMINTLRMGSNIRRRAKADPRLKLMLKRKERQRRRARISNPLSQSYPSSRSRRTGCLRKVSHGTSI
jgi:hypothetical protein